MKIRQANIEDYTAVMDISVTTIEETYPRYYPEGIIESYLDYHTEESIKKDINNKQVYVIEDERETAKEIEREVDRKAVNGIAKDIKKETEKIIVGTVTIRDNTLVRLFVSPQYQGNGYGKALMDFSEQLIFKSFDKIVVESSLPAKIMYKTRGYVETTSHRMTTRSGDYLCYDSMEKRKDDFICCTTTKRYVGEHLFIETTDKEG